MKFTTVDYWDEEIWQKWQIIYDEAFGLQQAKSEKIIRNMFLKQNCHFHIAMEETEVCAIALTGKLQETSILLIDYFAIKSGRRRQGIGRAMVEYLKKWAQVEKNFESILIEVEAEDTEENRERISFWQKCGFTLTSYVHDYKVVPEPYRAMYIRLVSNAVIPEKEEEFFNYMGRFHRKSFQGA